jgi:putative SOS response-associated peptidase YedK
MACTSPSRSWPCRGSRAAQPIYDRMPVVLTGFETWQAWLEPCLDSTAARELLSPIPPQETACGR